MKNINSSPPCGLTPPPVGSSIYKEVATSMVVDIRLAKFNDQEIPFFTDNGINYVALSSICKNMGISWATQYKRLMKDPTLKSLIKKKYRIVGGKSRQIICIPFDKLAGWFFQTPGCRK